MSENKIGLKTAIIIGVNAMIGSGILTIPTMLSANVGPAGLISMFLGVGLVLCIGLSFGRLAGMFPATGWSYNYPAKWAGHKVGILSAFFYLFGIIVGMGFVAQQAGIWCSRVFPNLSTDIVAVIIISVLTLLVLAGAKTSSWTQYLIVLLVLVPLLLTGVFSWAHFDINLTTPFIPFGVTSIFKSLTIALFALFGFESIASLFPIVEDPKKNVPRAFTYSILIVGAIYILFSYGILFSIPANFFCNGICEPLSSVLSKQFPTAGFLHTFVFISAVFGIIGTIHSMLWSVSELFTDVLNKTKSKFIKVLIKKNIWNFKTAVIVTAFLMALAAIFIDGGFLVSLTGLFIVSSYVLSIILLLFQKSEWKSKHNYVTLLGLLGGAILIYYAFKDSLQTFMRLFN